MKEDMKFASRQTLYLILRETPLKVGVESRHVFDEVMAQSICQGTHSKESFFLNGGLIAAQDPKQGFHDLVCLVQDDLRLFCFRQPLGNDLQDSTQ